MASSGVIYEEVNGDLSPFSTSDLGEIETPLYKVIIIPFLHKSYNLNCNNLEFAKLLIIYQF